MTRSRNQSYLFARDNDGNVWHLGQYRETYDEAEFVGGRIWAIGGLEGAKAGIMMPAHPQVGMPSYPESYAPSPFNWTDRARVYQMGQQIVVSFGSYEDVLVIEEYNQEDPGAFQLKYYARGVGEVGVGWRGDDPNQERMELETLCSSTRRPWHRSAPRRWSWKSTPIFTTKPYLWNRIHPLISR